MNKSRAISKSKSKACTHIEKDKRTKTIKITRLERNNKSIKDMKNYRSLASERRDQSNRDRVNLFTLKIDLTFLSSQTLSHQTRAK